MNQTDMDVKPLSVSELNSYIKSRFEIDEHLISVLVRGEISNYKVHSSGHHYFSLKDADSAIRCVMFKNQAYGLRFRPENGMNVIVLGKVSVYTRDGTYQIYCQKIIPDGAGELQMAFEQLKKKLYEEGLFDEAHKKPLPVFPTRIAVITSPSGAAVHDILNILNKRWPLSSVLIVPVLVQGPGAPEDIAEALSYVNRYSLADLIITGRGGGSIEDLWAFNTETVCRAIFRSDIPVISAVGHEPDITISDFVADLRASTPSNAAEYAVPDRKEIRERMASFQIRLESRIKSIIMEYRNILGELSRNRLMSDPSNIFNDYRLDLDVYYDVLGKYTEDYIISRKNDLVSARGRLCALNPLAVLSRGYSLAVMDGKTVSSTEQICENDRIQLIFNDGSAECTVNRIIKRE